MYHVIIVYRNSLNRLNRLIKVSPVQQYPIMALACTTVPIISISRIATCLTPRAARRGRVSCRHTRCVRCDVTGVEACRHVAPPGPAHTTVHTLAVINVVSTFTSTPSSCLCLYNIGDTDSHLIDNFAGEVLSV